MTNKWLGNEFLIPKHQVYIPDPTSHFPLVKIREKAKKRQEASGSGVQDIRKKEGMKEERQQEEKKREKESRGRKEEVNT